MALSVLVSSLAVTTLGQTVSPELTTPEGADPVGDKAEEGFVLDPATLVLGREDLHRRCSGNILVLGMRTPARVVSGVQRPPPEELQRRVDTATWMVWIPTKKMSRLLSSGMRTSTRRCSVRRTSSSK